MTAEDVAAAGTGCVSTSPSAAKLPQIPRHAGPDGLGFAGQGFRALLDGLVPRLELRVGARFSGDAAVAGRAAVQEPPI